MKKGNKYLANSQFVPAERCFNLACKKKPEDYLSQWGCLQAKTRNFSYVFSHQYTIESLKQYYEKIITRIPKDEQVRYNNQFVPYYNYLSQTNWTSRNTINSAFQAKQASLAMIDQEYGRALEDRKQRINSLEQDITQKEQWNQQLSDSIQGDIPKWLLYVFPVLAALVAFLSLDLGQGKVIGAICAFVLAYIIS